ncbi:glycerol dehydratase large subunit [Klebsiella pneumoniae]|nr:glycerol dehydratase large subunit [Klebsiella pneumoniae]
MKRSKRFAVLAQRPVNQDGLIGEWPEEGLIAMDSPFDPVSSVKVDNGLIVELDGKRRDQFDMIDRFIADYAINVERTEQAMRLEAVEIARMLVDIHVSREEIIAITTAITPAKAVEVMAQMNVVEMMMALQKMRARRTPPTSATSPISKIIRCRLPLTPPRPGSAASQNRRPRSVSRAMRRLTPWRCWSVRSAAVPAC